jgi:acyl transferase domain-containing protein/NAD(P)-dependent dehydrogenase (short-subunit alcohol dehydrogenase family)
MSSKSQPLAIVGISCLFPKADDLQTYWANIKNGVNAITPVPAGSHWNAADYFDADPKSPDRTYAQSGGFLSPVNFNPMEFGIAPKDIEATDTSQLLSLVAAQRALADAGYATGGGPGRPFDRSRTSVILGVTGALELVIPLGARLGHPIWRRALRDAGIEGTVAEDVVQRIADSYVGWQENSFPGLLGNVAAGRIANRLDLGGTNCVVDAACASSLAAIHLAGLELSTGRSDMVITGGVDTFNDIFMYMCFSKTPALSPTGDAKPFDRDCDGTVLGEGLGLLVLKRLADAERDGDRIYAVLRGIGSSSDGRSSAIYAPRAGGQKLALQRAYEDAGAAPETIGLIEAHGTGTKVGDATELSSLTEVFQSAHNTGARSAGPWCALGSVKSQIGHTKAAAGVAGVIKAAMALHEKVLPPTIKITHPLEEAASGRSPFYLNTVKRPWLPNGEHPRRAGVSALGFGGTNFHCVLEEHGARKAEVGWEGDVEILAFGAERLGDLKAQLVAHTTDSSWSVFRRAAYESRLAFQRGAAFRLLIVVARDSDRASLKDAALKMLEKNPGRTSWTAPAGIAFGSGTKPGKLGALFPGQGSQYAGMLRDLACQFPGMTEALAEADKVFAREPSRSGAQRLSDYIYPHPAFSDEARRAQEDALKATDIAQPALGAVSLGAFNVLNYFGVAADAACGHSYGELLALCGAGRIEPTALHQLSNLRGRLMAGRNGGDDRGAMLAVQADEEAVLTLLREEESDLVIANRNSPKQYVLAGPVEQIKRALANLTKRAIRSRMLQVSAAFHSPLVADARAPFAEALEGIQFDKGRVPVYANATGREYPASAKQAREVLASQIVRPVNFMEQIQAMRAHDVRTFVEVGPGHVLSDLVQSILPGGEVETIALDASRGGRSGTFDLALALARIAALGHEVNLAKWENAPSPVEANAGKPALTVALSGANYRAPTTPRPPAAVRPAAFPDSVPAALPAPVQMQMPAKVEDIPAALRATQEGILALQRLQEQTAQLHKQFLEGQESARRTIQTLLELRSGAAVPLTFAAPVSVAPVAAAPAIERQSPVVLPSVLPAPAAARARYEHAVLEIVCEKTGYPVEMLALSMGMDSDLGIDSIKRVEIMAALRAKLPEAPEIKPEHLGSLQTLEQVVAFLASGAPAATAPVPAIAPAAPPGLPDADATRHGAGTLHIGETLLAVVAEKTGYPVEMLNLGMGMDSDLGIDSIKRVEIMAALRGRLPGSPEVRPEHLGSLQTLQQVVNFLIGQPAEPIRVPAPVAVQAVQTVLPESSNPEELTEVLRQIIRPVAFSGGDSRETISLPAGARVWLTDDGSELCARIEERLRALRLTVHRGDLRRGFPGNSAASPAALVILAPAGGSHDAFLQQAFRLIQRAGPSLRKAGCAGTAILATVSRLDGAFGFGDLTDKGDPVSGGLAGLTKTARHEWPDVHCKAIDLDPGFIDAGEAAEQIVSEMFRVGPVEVGLSGSTRVALEVAAAAIERNGAHAPLSEGDVVVVTGGARGVTGDAALALARAFRPKLVLLGRSELGNGEPAWLQDLQTESGIKKALFDRQKSGGSPKAVEAQYRDVLAQREIRAQLGRLEAAGAQAVYHSVDVRDGAAVARILSEVRQRHGAIHGLVHGAGVLADRRIEDKTEEQFDRVYGTKVSGLRNLLGALAQEELKLIALFSSYTGRVGRIGQADYAAANEVLNKLAQVESRRRPNCRVVSVNWGPWNGGMATPGVRKLFEQEGIGLIEPAAGAAFLVRELCSADRDAIEVLALARSPGIGTALTQQKSAAPGDAVAFVREVSVEALPCLESHVFNGRAVLPAALMVEWLAQAALHGNPGMAFHGLDNFKVLKGIVLEARQSITVSLRTAAATSRDNLHVVPVRMTSQSDGREMLHAQADVLLTAENLPAAPEPAVFDISGGGFTDAYSLGVLFHGAALHGIERVEGLAERGIAAMLKAASAPIKWMTHPLRGTWIADPLALDSAFQMMILWSAAHRGAPSLPSALARYRQFVSVFPKGGCRAVIAVAIGISAIAVATIQFFDRQGNLLASAEGCEFVMDAALRDAFRLNRLGLEK